MADGRGRGAGVFARWLPAALLAAAALFAAGPAAAHTTSGDSHFHFRVVLSSNTATEGQTGNITVNVECVTTDHSTCTRSHPGDSYRTGADFTVTATNPSGSNNGVTQAGTTVGYAIPAVQPGVPNSVTYGTTSTGSVALALQDNSTQDGTRQVTVSASVACTQGNWWYDHGGRDVCPRIASATLVIEDDEVPTPGLTVNEGSDNATEVTEAGSADSFTVALATNPSAAVTVSVEVDDDHTGECEASLDGGDNYLAAGTAGTLTFVPTGGSTTAARTTPVEHGADGDGAGRGRRHGQ